MKYFTLFMLLACGEVLESKSQATGDLDQDGFSESEGDCDDFNNRVSPVSVEVCDGVDNDCDGTVDIGAVDAQSYALDGDEDGYPDGETVTEGCTAESGQVAWTGIMDDDCDDTDASVHPGAASLEPILCTRDNDGDGHGDMVVISPLEAGSDCDDSDGSIHPGALPQEGAEFCGIDADGDGFGDTGALPPLEAGTDCLDSDAAVYPGALPLEGAAFCGLDADGDGHGDVFAESPFQPGTDCDDSDGAISPLAPEVCDEVDNNCDGIIDEDAVDALRWYFDVDGDGFGGTGLIQSVDACEQPPGYVSNDADCDDTSAQVVPGGVEWCNGLDDNCDGDVDEGEGSTAPADAVTWYEDADGDGHAGATTTVSCEAPVNHLAEDSDCDDTDADIYPGAFEVCDGVDQNCDGALDEDATDALTFYSDSDGDGFGDSESTQLGCDAPLGTVSDHTDCDDTDGDIQPGAQEHCDGLDEDCDGVVDNDPVDPGTWYFDSDGDGHAGVGISITACDTPEAHFADHTDCDDANSAIHPDATEICDALDNDCDEMLDDDDDTVSEFSQSAYYEDLDTDGHGDPLTITYACIQPTGLISDASDCDDADAMVHPGADEYCNGLDEDCDEEVDENAVNTLVFYLDADGDGHGDSVETLSICPQLGGLSAPEGYAISGNDCDDTNAEVSPTAYELCTDSVDENCDGDMELGAIDPNLYYGDLDQDGYGDAGTVIQTCATLSHLSVTPGDCDDLRDSVYPGAGENCDGVLNDCDTVGGLTSGVPDFEWDADGDGFVTCILDVGPEDWEGTQVLAGGDDCDDNLDTVFPGAWEFCNGHFDDCDSRGGSASSPDDEWDDDGDGFVDCAPEEDWWGTQDVFDTDGIPQGEDCNDENPDVFPGAAADDPSLCTQDLDGDGAPDCYSDIPDPYFCDEGVTVVDGVVGFDLVRISAGLSADWSYELTHDFMMMNTEVTQLLFEEVMGYNPSHGFCAEDCPVQYLYKKEMQVFANVLSEDFFLETCYDCSFTDEGDLSSVTECNLKSDFVGSDFYTCEGYRLPSEAEWRFAAQAGQNAAFWTVDGGGEADQDSCDEDEFIDDDGAFPQVGDSAWFCGNTTSLARVALLNPNGWGLYDIFGNVMEMVEDKPLNISWNSYIELPASPIDPIQNLGVVNIFRGGHYQEEASDVDAFSRYAYPENNKSIVGGFRLVRTPNSQAPSPEVSLGVGLASEDLHCAITVDSEDVDGDTLTYTFDWMVDGVNHEGTITDTEHTGDTIPASELSVGQQWTCTVTPGDGSLEGHSGSAWVDIISDADSDWTLYLSHDVSMDFVRVSAGTDPLGRTTLTHDLMVQTTEITHAQYEVLALQNPSSFPGCGAVCPMDQINLYDGAVLANLLSVQGGFDSCYDCTFTGELDVRDVASCTIVDSATDFASCNGYRLPTEAEWDYFARAGETQDLSTDSGGATILDNNCISNALDVGGDLEEYSWLCSNAGSQPQPVATRLPNAWGLYDLHGNLAEWTQDTYQATFPASETDPLATGGGFHVIRGGSFESTGQQLAVGERGISPPDIRTDSIGVRLVRTVD